MSETSVREVVGILIVCLQLCLIGILYITFYRGGFTFPEFTTTIGIVAPMLAGYTTAVVTYFVRNRFVVPDYSRKVSMIFVGMSMLFPLLFFAVLATSVMFYSQSRVFENFESFKGTLTITESVFSAYVATLVYSLFQRADAVRNTGENRP